MHNANSERLSERLSTQSIRVLNRMYLERIYYIYIFVVVVVYVLHKTTKFSFFHSAFQRCWESCQLVTFSRRVVVVL